MCVLVYKCLHQGAPVYLSELCIPVASSTGRSHLRSVAKECLVISYSVTTGLRTMGNEVSRTLAQHCGTHCHCTLRDKSTSLSSVSVLFTVKD